MAQDYYEEKRSFARMQVNTPVQYQLKSEPDITYHGISQDLSATGLFMSSEFAPNAGAEISITMTTANEKLPPFTAEGTVLRVQPEQGHYLISVKLTDIQ